MTTLATSTKPVKLLVSVRDAAEARAAIAGGADIIDIKEPAHGPLGRAATNTIYAIAQVVADRVPLSIALGELTQLDIAQPLNLPSTTAYVKAGLAGMVHHDWRRQLAALQQAVAPITLVPVAYWDWQAADAPSPAEVLAWAATRGLHHLLIDTACKTQPGLLEHPDDAAALAHLKKHADVATIHIALAGRLMGDRITQAVALQPAIIGVRSAACEGGRRDGKVCSEAIGRIKAIINLHANA